METRIPSVLDGLICDIIALAGVIALMSTVAWEVLVLVIPLIFAAIWYQVILLTLMAVILFVRLRHF